MQVRTPSRPFIQSAVRRFSAIATRQRLFVGFALGISLSGAMLSAQTQAPAPRQVVPIVGHVTGVGGSEFRSDLQLYNPSNGVISGSFIYTPRNQSASTADTTVTFEIPPFYVLVYEDIYDATFPGVNGAARLVIVLDRGVRTRPIVETSTYTATPDGGELGQSPTVFLDTEYAGVGARLAGVLGKVTERTNLFLMTGEQGVTIRWSYRDSFSRPVPPFVRAYPGSATFQLAAAEVLGFPPAPNASLEAFIEAGSARIASNPVNNITNQGRWSDFKIVPP